MKGGWPFWVFVAGLVVLHLILHLTLGLDRRAPDLLTLAVLLSARQLPGARAAAIGFVLGLLEDGLSLSAFGAATVAQTVVGYLGARSRDLFVGESVFFLGLYFFLGKWVRDALYYGLAAGVRRGDTVGALLVQAPLDALYLAAVGIALVLIYRTILR